MLIDDWGGTAPLQARVRLVEPSGFTKLSALGVEEQRVNVIGDFVDAAVPLADGYRVEARIVVWEGDDVVKVPSSALFRRAGDWNVFVVDGGRARRRSGSDRTARRDGGRRCSADSTTATGSILHPSDQVDDGVRVAPL